MLLDKTRQGDEIEVTPQMIDAGVSVLWGLEHFDSIRNRSLSF